MKITDAETEAASKAADELLATCPSDKIAVRGVLISVFMLAKQVARLNARLADAERRGLDYRGVWSASVDDYQRGDTVTRGGSLWVCKEPTRTAPGESPYWQLAVKRGRDGRQAA